MADRYSTTTREVPVDHPRNTVFVPGDETHPAIVAGRLAAEMGPGRDLNSQHRVSLHPAGFRVRERGALESTVIHAYRCPVHGLVDRTVLRIHVPDEVPCLETTEPDERGIPTGCTEIATWAGSQCGQGWAAGECKS